MALSVAEAVQGGHARLAAAFNALDADGDGLISQAEIKAACLRLNIEMCPQELMQLVHRVDVDGDGFIAMHEFKRVQALKLHLIAQGILEQHELMPDERRAHIEQV
ncbi:hypothetical protein AB1Y20_021202 [Prymnesium parvum]|uniref:EF-hand domain-containing protein n=1 Tax=Prymnesium parvum TaxID=97485 RepID=A0AB34JKQ4_PRYPA